MDFVTSRPCGLARARHAGHNQWAHLSVIDGKARGSPTESDHLPGGRAQLSWSSGVRSRQRHSGAGFGLMAIRPELAGRLSWNIATISSACVCARLHVCLSLGLGAKK